VLYDDLTLSKNELDIDAIPNAPLRFEMLFPPNSAAFGDIKQ
jgi:hypothetical protein